VNKIIPIVFIILAVLVSPLAVSSSVYYEIPASTVDKVYVLNATLPVWYKITLKGLVANTSMDNIALSFRDDTAAEILNLFIKTYGKLVVTMPKFNVLEKEIGNWTDGTTIYIYFGNDKIEIYLDSPYGSPVYNYSVSTSYNIYDVRVHSNDDTHQAYTAGTIILEETTVINPAETITETTTAVFPLMITLIGIAIPLMFIKIIIRFLNKIF